MWKLTLGYYGNNKNHLDESLWSTNWKQGAAAVRAYLLQVLLIWLVFRLCVVPVTSLSANYAQMNVGAKNQISSSKLECFEVFFIWV
jgi:hypothetical protein